VPSRYPYNKQDLYLFSKNGGFFPRNSLDCAGKSRICSDSRDEVPFFSGRKRHKDGTLRIPLAAAVWTRPWPGTPIAGA
jgi:hypothetical protein